VIPLVNGRRPTLCAFRHPTSDNLTVPGSYFGMTPSPYYSGSMRVDQGISKAGNPRARRLAIEIAWLWIRHQPDSALTKWFVQRVGDAKGRVRDRCCRIGAQTDGRALALSHHWIDPGGSGHERRVNHPQNAGTTNACVNGSVCDRDPLWLIAVS
jgi:Transposase IS116/IS110/IS902 family